MLVIAFPLIPMKILRVKMDHKMMKKATGKNRSMKKFCFNVFTCSVEHICEVRTEKKEV